MEGAGERTKRRIRPEDNYLGLSHSIRRRTLQAGRERLGAAIAAFTARQARREHRVKPEK
jgi:hypothetical protein